MVIIPTDDPRLKLVVIPAELIDSDIQNGSYYNAVANQMSCSGINEADGQALHLYLPAFKSEVSSVSPLTDSIQGL
jgi:hypothetical protein